VLRECCRTRIGRFAVVRVLVRMHAMSFEKNLRQAIKLTQEMFCAGIGQAGIVDVGFIGNTGGFYMWEPALIVDIDVCLFVRQKDATLGRWLFARREEMRAAVDRLGMDFDLRVLRGPYKPAQWQLARPIAIAHLAVFTKEGYAQEPPTLRWSWRKYRCVVEPSRLGVDQGEAPGWPELREMATRKRARIQAGRVQMTEWELPDFALRQWQFDADHPVFVEYCLAAALLCARNHGRVLGRPESDRLGNRDYVAWYRREVLPTEALEGIQGLKEHARQHGYAGLMPQARDHAEKYLQELLSRIPTGV
jgi:hypothetical protein